METFSALVEALGLVLGSFAVAAGIVAAIWKASGRVHHPEWGAPAIALLLLLVLATRLVRGEFLSMVAILLIIAAPFLWAERRARRFRKPGGRRGSGPDRHPFR